MTSFFKIWVGFFTNFHFKITVILLNMANFGDIDPLMEDNYDDDDDDDDP